MRVGNEHDIDVHVLDEVRDSVGVAVEEANPVRQERVGENADAIDLYEDRGVSEVANVRTHRPSLMRE